MVVCGSSSIAVATTEITQRQFTLLMGYNPATATGDPDLPVESLTAIEAAAYCDALSKLEGYSPCYANGSTLSLSFYFASSCDGYRLPEWNEQFSAEPIISRGWFQENAGGRPQRVATKAPDRCELFDVLGNVAEMRKTQESDVVSAVGGSWDDSIASVTVASSSVLSLNERRPTVGFRIVRTLKDGK
jgi:formylglycine-generating enzyme required for sulfatase activity